MIRELGRATGMFLSWLWDAKLSGSTFNGKIAKIVIYAKGWVNGGTIYDSQASIQYIYLFCLEYAWRVSTDPWHSLPSQQEDVYSQTEYAQGGCCVGFCF